jgi:hypothetical protein
LPGLHDLRDASPDVARDLARGNARLGAAADYGVDYSVIGDPAVGCPKDYVAQWRCGGSPVVRRADAPPEAGFGAVVTLSCPR